MLTEEHSTFATTEVSVYPALKCWFIRILKSSEFMYQTAPFRCCVF